MKMFKLNPFSSKNALPQLCGSLLLMLPAAGYAAEANEQEECTPEQIELGAEGCDIAIEETIIVTGYSTQRKEDLTGAISVVELGDIEDLPAGNIMKNLQGKIPGLSIRTDGNPGSTASIRIRGQGIGRLGNNDPLYIIDGIPTKLGMHELNSRDFASIQVLKDASAASIYGARSGNGVIVITTKNGASQDIKFDVAYSQSTQDFSYDLNPLNTEQRAQVIWQAAVNDGSDPNAASPLYQYDWNGDYASPQLNKIILPNSLDQEGNTTPAVPGTDWFGEVIQTSKIRDFHVSASGGSDRGHGYISLGYFDAEGVVKGSKFERISFRANSRYEIIDDVFAVGENLTVTHQVENQNNRDAGNIVSLAIEQQSIVPVYNDDGSDFGGPRSGINDRRNPVSLIEGNKGNDSRYNRLMGNVFAELKPIDGLTLRSNFGLDYGQFYYRRLFPTVSEGNLYNEERITTQDNWEQTTVWSNTAEYKTTFDKKHNLTVLAGTEAIEFEREGFFVSSTGLLVEDRDYAFLDAATGGGVVAGGGDEWSLNSYFAKVDYNYDDKYLLSGTIRRDGSSRFGDNNQYGNFPAFSGGWVVSNEDFFDVPLVSTLKLRASWGRTGNQEIDTRATTFTYQTLYSTPSVFTTEQDNGTAYDIGGNDQGVLPSGFVRTQTANPDLKWETSEMVNFGVDFSLYYGTIYGTLDIFDKETSDILTVTSPLATLGEGAQQIVNGGTVTNKGWEFTLGYDDYVEIDGIGEIKFDVFANLFSSDNEVTYLPENVKNTFGGNGDDITILGHSVNANYGYVADGLFQSDAEVNEHADQTGAAPGRIRYADLNQDGVIDDKDQMFFAEMDPDYEYGFGINLEYENWDFSMFWQGIEGGQIRNGWRNFTDLVSVGTTSNFGDRVLSAWTPENSNSDIPALSLQDTNGEGRNSTFYYEDASYLKLRNITLGYKPDDKTVRDWGISNIRVYLSASNLLTFTPDGTISQDPETPDATFPVPRTITFGIDVGF
ncbi:SusC/RagA family TonB-linked outer membrane protein [Catenovulum sediminis]|uniref:SusC/RagA family TonB-linked outer membrane protein n=1 Tax=Catenovulum sediminis TaxID=1740262 RepID=UPI00117C385E|nr:SusC/RagA family TonB-linked outer membrane protein [Catenovulum sediminis]